jgi:elongation factor P
MEFAMLSSSDLRKGLKILMDDAPYIITKFDFSKPGKGQSLYKCRMRNMINGNSTDRTFRSNDKFEKAPLEERAMQFLYSQVDEFHFMDSNTYEQLFLTRDQIADNVNYMVDNMDVSLLFFNETPIDITLPIFANLTVTKADPWAKGDTSGTDTKPVTVETGYILQVPPFIEEGEKIQIDTRTGAYMTRVKE